MAKRVFLTIFLCILGSLILLSYSYSKKDQTKMVVSDSKEDSIEKTTTEIFRDKQQLFRYVKKFGPQQAVERLHQLSSQYGDCHQPAHEAGRFSYQIYKEKAFQECGAYCHSGCYHGATEEFFRVNGTANLEKDLGLLCNSELNSFYSHQCVHGIGHGLMAWSSYDLPSALESCDMLTNGQSSCWTGVFMENIVGALAVQEKTKDDNNTVHFTSYLNNDPHFPCSEVEEKYKSACYFLQTSRMMQLFRGDMQKIADACARAPDTYSISCFESMGRDVGGVHRDNPRGAIQACAWADKGKYRNACLRGAAQDTFWDISGQRLALEFCKELSDGEEKDSCYSTIIPRSTQVLSTKSEKQQFCNQVELQFQNECYKLNGI